MAQILLGRNEAKRIDSVPLTDDTVNNRIAGITNDILRLQEMKEGPRAKDVFNLVNAFLRENLMAWTRVRLVCTDDAPAMIGHRSGFVALIKQVALHIVSNHHAVHKHALACKTLPLEWKSVLDSVVKAVNFICGRVVNSRLFKAFCDDLGKEHQYFLFHTEVRWLSREKCSPVLQNLSL